MYSPSLGRFIQPDTIVPNPSNPQDYNRYSYVLNRPINLTDPTGHCYAVGGSSVWIPDGNDGPCNWLKTDTQIGSKSVVPTSTPDPFAVVVPLGVATPEFMGTPVPYLTHIEIYWTQGRSYWKYGEFDPMTDENTIEIPIGYIGDPAELSVGGFGITLIDPLDDAFPGLEESLSSFQTKFIFTSKVNVKIQEVNLIISKTQYDSHYTPQTSYTIAGTRSIIVNVQPAYRQNLPFINLDFYIYPNSSWAPIP